MIVQELIDILSRYYPDSEVEICAIPKFKNYFVLEDIDIFEDNHGIVTIQGREI